MLRFLEQIDLRLEDPTLPHWEIQRLEMAHSDILRKMDPAQREQYLNKSSEDDEEAKELTRKEDEKRMAENKDKPSI